MNKSEFVESVKERLPQSLVFFHKDFIQINKFKHWKDVFLLYNPLTEYQKMLVEQEGADVSPQIIVCDDHCNFYFICFGEPVVNLIHKLFNNQYYLEIIDVLESVFSTNEFAPIMILLSTLDKLDDKKQTKIVKTMRSMYFCQPHGQK